MCSDSIPVLGESSKLLIEAHRAGASNIHLEPLDKKFRVRFRIDGVLQEMQAPPKRLQSAIVSRLKIMTGSMSIAEKRLPQDGRIQVRMGIHMATLREWPRPDVVGIIQHSISGALRESRRRRRPHLLLRNRIFGSKTGRSL